MGSHSTTSPFNQLRRCLTYKYTPSYERLDFIFPNSFNTAHFAKRQHKGE